MTDETCPECGDALVVHSDVYEYYPSNIKYVKWLQCLSCKYEKVLEEQDF